MFQDLGFGELERELGKSGERELGEPDGELRWALTAEPREATALTQYLNKQSKNPYKRSLVREVNMK